MSIPILINLLFVFSCIFFTLKIKNRKLQKSFGNQLTMRLYAILNLTLQYEIII